MCAVRGLVLNLYLFCRGRNMPGFMIAELADCGRVHVTRSPGGTYSCPAIAGGVQLSAYAMQAALRLKYKPYGTPRVVCWGWTTYKAVCERMGLDWRQCVYATKPADLESAARIVVDDSYAHPANPKAQEMAQALAAR